MPHLDNTSLTGRDLNAEYGLTIEKLQEYLSPMNILSGGGFQKGLDVGSRVYANKLNFKGMVIGLPFNLKGTDEIKINPKPKRYPIKCSSSMSV
jgi:hypothetical protein